MVPLTSTTGVAPLYTYCFKSRSCFLNLSGILMEQEMGEKEVRFEAPLGLFCKDK